MVTLVYYRLVGISTPAAADPFGGYQQGNAGYGGFAQPPQGGAAGADRMAASDPTPAMASAAAAPIRSPVVLIFPLNTGRMEIPFVGFPRLAQTAPGALLTLTCV